MAAVILEIENRGLNQYHRLERFPVTVGRALDNDIILSDDSISPHHLRIDKTPTGQIELQNLSTENGTRLNKQELGSAPRSAKLPSQLLLGNRKARLLSSDMPVEVTHVDRCTGWLRLFCHPVSAATLFILNIVMLVANNYFSTDLDKDTLYYFSNLLPNLLLLFFWVLSAVAITRLVTHRWQFMPAISLASLFSLLPQVLDEVGHFLDYFFTSDTPSTWLSLGIGEFLLIPSLLFVFLRWVLHQRVQLSLSIALLLSALPLGLRAVNLIDQWTVDSEFSAEANYSQSLSSLNIHAGAVLPLDRYFDEAIANLPEQPPTRNAVAKQPVETAQ